MKKNIAKLLNFLDQLPIILTVILAALAVAVNQVFSLSINVQLSIILGVIALLGTSELVAKYRETRKISEDVHRTRMLIEAQMGGIVSAEAFFKDGIPDFGNLLEQATDISLMSATLMAFTTNWKKALKSRLEEGARVHMIILENSTSSLEIASFRTGDKDVDSWKLHLATAAKNINQIQKELSSKGNLEVRTIKYPPAYAIAVFNLADGSQRLTVELWPHQSHEIRTNPFFVLSSDKDPKWFQYFKDQFEVTWKNADKWIG